VDFTDRLGTRRFVSQEFNVVKDEIDLVFAIRL